MTPGCYEAVRLTTRSPHHRGDDGWTTYRPARQKIVALDAVATMRRWPRGPGWSRMLLVGEPRVRSYDDNRVDGVGLLDLLRGRRLPLATSPVRNVPSRAVELVLNPKATRY